MAEPCYRETTANFLRIRGCLRKFRPENICEFSHLRDLRDEIPCATEQGNNSTTTGNLIRANKELIRYNGESAQVDPLAAMKRLFRPVPLDDSAKKCFNPTLWIPLLHRVAEFPVATRVCTLSLTTMAALGEGGYIAPSASLRPFCNNEEFSYGYCHNTL